MIPRRAIIAGLLILTTATAASAQFKRELVVPHPQQAQQNDPAFIGLDLAARQVAVAAAQFALSMQREIAAREARIVELEKLCGDPCKPPKLEPLKTVKPEPSKPEPKE